MSQESVLTGLDEVPWEELEHAYGFAEDVPQLLTDLASEDPEIRSNAWTELYGNLYHQGTVYEATAYAVPFLLALLAAPGVEDKEHILVYLGYLASGTSYHDVHGPIHVEDQQDPAKYAEVLSYELGWVRETREAVVLGCSLYQGFLHDEHPPVRAAAAYLLRCCPEHREVLDDLLARLIDEDDELARAAIALTLGHFPGMSHLIDRLLEQLHSDRSVSVRVTIALALAQLQPSQLDDAVRAQLLEVLRHPKEAEDLFSRFPWDEEEIQVLCMRALKESGAIVEALDVLIRMMDEDPSVVWLMLDAIDDPPLCETPADQLSKEQQLVLQTIAESQSFWRRKGTTVLISYNLPQTKRELQAFLSHSTWQNTNGQSKNKFVEMLHRLLYWR